jgi:hypothetical protein
LSTIAVDSDGVCLIDGKAVRETRESEKAGNVCPGARAFLWTVVE